MGMASEEDHLFWQDAQGARIPFETYSYDYEKTHSLSVNPRALFKKTTNTSSGIVSAKTHLKNRLIMHTPKEKRLLAYDGFGNRHLA